MAEYRADDVVGVRRDLITATSALAGLSSFLFGFLTNLPVALAYVSHASTQLVARGS